MSLENLVREIRADQLMLVVFDFDGTLADSFAAFCWAVERAAVRHGFRNIDRSRLDELRGCSVRQLMKHLGIPLWKVPASAAEIFDVACRRPAQRRSGGL